jgi:hypothetical protein
VHIVSEHAECLIKSGITEKLCSNYESLRHSLSTCIATAVYPNCMYHYSSWTSKPPATGATHPSNPPMSESSFLFMLHIRFFSEYFILWDFDNMCRNITVFLLQHKLLHLELKLFCNDMKEVSTIVLFLAH